MMHQGFHFFIERLSNAAWIVGWLQGTDDYGRFPKDRAGFTTYEEAESFAVKQLRKMLRKERDAWAKAEEKKAA